MQRQGFSAEQYLQLLLTSACRLCATSKTRFHTMPIAGVAACRLANFHTWPRVERAHGERSNDARLKVL